MSPALFLFELLKMSKLTRGPLVLYHLPKYWGRKKIKAKNVGKKQNKFQDSKSTCISSDHKQNACKVSEAFA